MTSYWVRHRLLLTLTASIVLAIIISLLFVYPYVEQRAVNYNSQSLFKNTHIDFIAPEPSYEQVSELPSTHGIEAVFSFYLTKVPVSVNGKSRTTTVLITDQNQPLEGSMYNSSRLIQQSGSSVENPILVDWQFCKETGAKVGDNISFEIGAEKQEFKIAAIYETNMLYDGGALLVQVSDEVMQSIRQGSQNSGYSGMYVSANDYDTCRLYLTTDYRPLGRLRPRDQFADDSQYQIHYDAIMASGYANEITDFRVKESELDRPVSSLAVWLGALLSIAVIIAFNVIMSNRGCEKEYFTRRSIPNGQDVKPYYVISFIAETLTCVVVYVVALLIRINSAAVYIPGSALNFYLFLFPISVLATELICLMLINRSVYAAKRSAVVVINNQRTQANASTAAQQTSGVQIATDDKILEGKAEGIVTATVDNPIAVKENQANVSATSTTPEARKPE